MTHHTETETSTETARRSRVPAQLVLFLVALATLLIAGIDASAADTSEAAWGAWSSWGGWSWRSHLRPPPCGGRSAVLVLAPSSGLAWVLALADFGKVGEDSHKHHQPHEKLE